MVMMVILSIQNTPQMKLSSVLKKCYVISTTIMEMGSKCFAKGIKMGKHSTHSGSVRTADDQIQYGGNQHDGCRLKNAPAATSLSRLQTDTSGAVLSPFCAPPGSKRIMSV